MIEKILVMSRRDAERETHKKNNPNTAIISITDIYNPKSRLLNVDWLRDVLRLKFDDEEEGLNSIQQWHTEAIRQFVEHINNQDVPILIVHCEAGISRSAGVAAAIGKFLFNDDSFVFNDGKFCPNMKCYREVLNTFMCDLSEQEIQEKINKNISAWKKKNMF